LSSQGQQRRIITKKAFGPLKTIEEKKFITKFKYLAEISNIYD
jgi:hypothetical protein